jgi:uncharacterized protein (DUF4213/DUF364 family)
MYSSILKSLTDYPLKQVLIGRHWTAAVVDKNGAPQCGLASTMYDDYLHPGESIIPDPALVKSHSALELASWILSEIPLQRSIGCAVINALLPREPESWIDQNAEEAIRERGKGKNIVLIGHFPFASALREEMEDFVVLELNPKGGDIPASAAPHYLPEADLIAITGMTFINHTLEALLKQCNPDAYVLLIGPSTPLTPVLADFGVNLLAGSSVESIPPVLEAIEQGATFRQVHKAGVRLITQLVG